MSINTQHLLTEALDEVSVRYGINNNLQNLTLALASRDAKEIQDYVISKLSEGLDESARESFRQLAENSYNTKVESFLYENTASSLSTFATLDNLILREVFDRTGAREAMTYKVLNQPYTQISYMRQYIQAKNGEMIPVPQGLDANSLLGKVVTMNVDMSTKPIENVFDHINASTLPEFEFTPVNKLTLKDYGRVTKLECYPQDNFSGTKIDVPVNIEFGQEGSFQKDITFKDSGGTTYAVSLAGFVNRSTGEVKFFSNKKQIKVITYVCTVSPETNQTTMNLSKKMEKINISVGDGETINSDMPIQYVQDIKALFNVDAVADISKTMAETFAQYYDIQVYNTFRDAITTDDQKQKFDASMIYGGAHIGISQQMHNAGMLQMIYNGIAAIDNRNNFRSDTQYFVICNPSENALLSGSIAPEYAGSVSAGGSISHYTGNKIIGGYENGFVKTISSKHYKRGEVYIVAKPQNEDHIAFGYYDYSQVIMPMNGYRNDQNPLVPNIMMNKRKAIHTFRPEAAQQLVVSNSNAIYGAL